MTTITESTATAALLDVLRIVEAGKTPPQEDDEWTCEELRAIEEVRTGEPVTYNQMAAILRTQVAAGKLTKRLVRAHSGRDAQAYRVSTPAR